MIRMQPLNRGNEKKNERQERGKRKRAGENEREREKEKERTNTSGWRAYFRANRSVQGIERVALPAGMHTGYTLQKADYEQSLWKVYN